MDESEEVRRQRVLAHELTMSHRRGWKDAASSRPKREEFLTHPRSELREAYARGYQFGLNARVLADQEACAHYGHVPNPLR